MAKDKLTFSISKINLLIILIILALLFLPIPSYQLKPVACPLMFRQDGGDLPCPAAEKGWVLSKSVFFRIADLIKNNFFYPPQQGQSEAVPGDAGVIDSEEPGEE
ncbi:hypothetical protein A3J20_05175 [Candidatus Gottesmanbacteria bacterium RIFCSPLOWO2_02_FULL_42_29]|uniref:Uncharacterized protein n=2 Tax=Candidatus Gottesmaniibacteriota TaxID=1752720 RepID=A0A1F6BC56_9BACT|nr:MAG: hypothetical protein UV09_C0016G0011 [Candidatus Gottesmanbacteria bacterium GW2011_GWA2_42_18]KKS76185.1 MAG: hypothetical protein UV46_C0007G0011 [Candidatus Gottesmanbacteria bacterium GW2011_GWC2_42_8]OGG11107.1 MAG: hypothetical protein A2781_00105 [Candidatus Gottesmanbacteria bacterium RIFCSPHIGHO2_01_FULL_42_27]OGG20662.1 MAG: hypothetical protein A3E72_05205 [Candidatus Gottesmanbacteria bacterium RIFCSPHIGHO2_12_FULL_43_26]OGG33930.1 MAG: hypothetical protein A3G68_00175 [Cand